MLAAVAAEKEVDDDLAEAVDDGDDEHEQEGKETSLASLTLTWARRSPWPMDFGGPGPVPWMPAVDDSQERAKKGCSSSSQMMAASCGNLLRPCCPMLAAFAAVDDVDDESAEAEAEVDEEEERTVKSASALTASSMLATGWRH